jgi:glycosyltransferase involved in cell wall biosynthesis
MAIAHITVCICTYKRPELLRKLLRALAVQQTDSLFSYSVVVADNDREGSGWPVVAEFDARGGLQIIYCVQPEQNIALTRNAALAKVSGEFVAFIDDDEFPEEDWLVQLYKTCVEKGVAGVLGPVRPFFEQEPPAWIRRGGFCERPSHPTGYNLRWDQCRTGNVLVRREIMTGQRAVFDPQFGSGGEDMDFFRRSSQKGCTFVWCEEAVAYEAVPASRLRRIYMLKRALLRGKNILKHPSGRWTYLATSLAAAPFYLIFLPVTVLLGQHYFMKYAIKLCDHCGRLLGIVGLNPLAERDM